MTEIFQDLLKDLLRLEISTIVRDEINTDKVRSIRFLLLDLAGKYRSKLSEIEDETDFHLAEKRHFYVFENLSAGEISYKEIMAFADRLMNFIKNRLTEIKEEEQKRYWRENLVMCSRIFKQSQLITDIFEDLKRENEGLQDANETFWTNDYSESELEKMEDLELNPKQLSFVRKAREIGTQRILMQTIVQIEGDITTYLTPRFLSMKEHDQKQLLHVHNSSITSAIRMWQYLFTTIGNLAGSFMSKGKKGKK
jgi:hypothetical protein